MLESYLDPIESLTDEIQKLDRTIEERAGSLKDTKLLMSIPGVSYFTALTIYAELGNITRFDGDKAVVSFILSLAVVWSASSVSIGEILRG